MKFVELKRELKTKIASSYLIFGEDNFLCDSAVSLIVSSVINDSEINKNIFTTENLSSQKFIDCLNTLPFFNDKKVVILKEYDGRKNADLIPALKGYLQSPSESTCLVIIKAEESDFFTPLKPYMETVDCTRLEKPMIKKWILNKLSESKSTINSDALDRLIDYTNGYLSRIDMELNKLTAYSKGQIKKEDVEEIVSKDLEYSIFEFTEALSSGNSEKCFLIKQDLTSNKKVLSTVLPLIQSHFRRLFYASISDGTNMEIAEQLGVKEYAIKKSREQGKKFSKRSLKKILELCEDMEYKTKTSAISVENAVDYLILNILSTAKE